MSFLKSWSGQRRGVYLRGLHVSSEAADLSSGKLVKSEYYVLYFGPTFGGEGWTQLSSYANSSPTTDKPWT